MYELHHGDCLSVIKNLPDNSIDMVLADPPYGTTRNAWDTPIDFSALWPELWRVAKPNAAVCLFSQMPFTVDLVQSQRKWFRYEWIIEKSNATGFLNAYKMPLKCHENLLVFYKKAPVYDPQFERAEPYKVVRKPPFSSNYGLQTETTFVSDGKRFPRDVIKFNNGFGEKERGLHPTQKSASLCEYFVRTYTHAGGVVLDFCMGSGSTGVACLNAGRSFVGIEYDKNFFSTAQARLNNTNLLLQQEGA